MLPSLFLNLFNPLFSVFYGPNRPLTSAVSTAAPQLKFQLRHLHAVSKHGHVLFSDVDHALYAGNLTAYASEEYTIDTRLLPSYRPPSFDAVENARYRSMKYGQSALLDWDEEEIVGPDVESREALLTLAKMTSNAYLQPEDKGWYPLENWTTVRLRPSLDPSRIHSFSHAGL
jgi:lipase ATG15